jgi:hypothetical protein
LKGGFSLANPLRQYALTYQVCNDWQANGWERGRIAAPYPPGLGFKRPHGHMWYYNGYIGIKVDGRDASRYVLTELAERSGGDDDHGRVDVVWETPFGRIELAFVMAPEHEGVFQQLTLFPVEPVGRVDVGFRSYATGFTKLGGLYHRTGKAAGCRWSLTGNNLLDRAYGKGRGTGAILVPTTGWTEMRLTARPSLAAVIDASIGPRTGPQASGELADDGREDAAALDGIEGLDDLESEVAAVAAAEAGPVVAPAPVRLRWVLWMFPDRTNAEAEAYMQREAATSAELLEAVFAE